MNYCPINAKFGRKKQNHVGHRKYDQNTKFQKFKMADGRHFENGFIIIYLSQESSDFGEIWCADANFGPKNGHVTK